jgi:hypothetical protein
MQAEPHWAQALGRVRVAEAVVRRHPRRLPGADQEKRARRVQADPRAVPVCRGRGVAAREGRAGVMTFYLLECRGNSCGN